MHLRFDATSAVVSTPSPPQGATQVSLRLNGFVAGNCSVACRFPYLCILARWDHCAGISGRNCLMAFARVIRPICGDTSDILISWDLVQAFGPHRSIPDVVGGDFDSPHLQRFFVDAYVNLAPDAGFWAAVLACVPLAFTFGLDACDVHSPLVAACSNKRG